MKLPLVRPLVKPAGYWLVEEEQSWGPFTVFKNFITDWASIPRVLWPVFSPYKPQYLRAALFHDYLYESHRVSREMADRIFFDLLMEDGCYLATAYMFWSGVRVGGYFAYKSGPSRQIQRRKEYNDYEAQREGS